MGYPRIYLLVITHCSLFCVSVFVCYIVYLSDTALEGVLWELLRVIYTGIAFYASNSHWYCGVSLM